MYIIASLHYWQIRTVKMRLARAYSFIGLLAKLTEEETNDKGQPTKTSEEKMIKVCTVTIACSVYSSTYNHMTILHRLQIQMYMYMYMHVAWVWINYSNSSSTSVSVILLFYLNVI